MKELDIQVLTSPFTFPTICITHYHSGAIFTEGEAEKISKEIPQALKLKRLVEERIKEIENDNEYHASQGCGTSIIQNKPFLSELQSLLDRSKK